MTYCDLSKGKEIYTSQLGMLRIQDEALCSLGHGWALSWSQDLDPKEQVMEEVFSLAPKRVTVSFVDLEDGMDESVSGSLYIELC